ncbi:MAG: type II toxin-antitoxin system HicA family toxin [Tannerella sp.]|jgi:predicted RNA binding protein YcfA (HicA-like mRNA interferase family)|nr:type II toxin-antitoxin system HicA family toxin [Tannerella sp.]
MKYSELERRAKENGCRFDHNSGSGHPVWYSPITGNYFELSHHRNEEVRPGTLKSIRKASGIGL